MKNTHTHTHAHARTHTHAHTHIHTYTHTHARTKKAFFNVNKLLPQKNLIFFCFSTEQTFHISTRIFFPNGSANYKVAKFYNAVSDILSVVPI